MTAPAPLPRRHPARTAAWVLARGATVAALLGTVALGAGFAWFTHRAAQPAMPGPATPGIAVLTGGPDRVAEGFSLLAARPGTVMVVSGVGPDPTLAELMRAASPGEAAEPEAAEVAGFAPRVTLGRRATSTSGNAREVAQWAREKGIDEITVVTAGFHMPRAVLELGRELPGARLHPHPVEPFAPRRGTMLREYAKLVGAFLGLSRVIERPDRVRPGGR